ncbi:hypothetical protein FOPE_06873 [Fonsecaea pedrosoi]|nr:hypothetical protein FOPE_06873 [Fonsecaea pedrosoi]
METKPRVNNHSKRWSKMKTRRQLSTETVSTPPAATAVPPVEEESDSESDDGLDSEDDLDESDDEDEDQVDAVQPSSAAPTQTSSQQALSSTTLPTPTLAQSSVQTSAIPTVTAESAITVPTSAATTLDTSIIPTSSNLISTTSAVPTPAIVSSESSSNPLSATSIAAIGLGSIIGAACLGTVLYYTLVCCCRRRRSRQDGVQNGEPYGDQFGEGPGDQARILNYASPPAVAEVQPQGPPPGLMPFRQTLSTLRDSGTEIPTYGQAVTHNPFFHPIIPGNETSRDEKPVHLFREQVDPFPESARTSQFTGIEGFALEPRTEQQQPPPPSQLVEEQDQAPPGPQFSRFPAPASPAPVSLPAPELAHIHPTLRPTSHRYTEARSRTVSSIINGYQSAEIPPSTLSPMRSVFAGQRHESLTPSESASNLPYDREGVKREMEKLQAMAAKLAASNGRVADGVGLGRYESGNGNGDGQRWI